MQRSNKYTAALALAAALVGTASGQVAHWTGLNGNDAWNNLNNWDIGVPSATTKQVWLQIPAGNPSSTVMTIPMSYTANVGTSYIGDNVTYATIFGPEWGATLNIHGTLNYDWMLYPVGSVPNPSFVNMDGNSSLSGVNLGIGDSWWFHNGPYVTMTMSGNAQANIAWLWWGGHLNLAGGTMNVSAGVVANIYNDGSLAGDATRLIEITEGRLILGFGDQTSMVNDWISRGILKAYGGGGTINIDTLTMPGQTIVTALVPEPSSLALLGFGGLALFVCRGRRPGRL